MNIRTASALAISIAHLACTIECAETVFELKGDALVIPAEAGQLTPPMQARERGDYEGGRYVSTDEGNRGGVRYRVRVPKAGRYYLFAHAEGKDSTADSFFVEIGREPDRTDPNAVWDVVKSKSFWQPVTGRRGAERPVREWQLSAGEHVLYVSGRERYAALDVLALTADAAAQLPTFGPPLDLGEYGSRRGPTMQSRVPLIYYISYTDKYFTAPQYLDAFRAAPPDVLHVGKAVPITHNWGPVPMLFGENQATGGPGHTLNWDNIRLLSPAELRNKTELITATVKRAHEMGIRYVCPYIGQRALAGDPSKRQGFWNFYDHWDDYADWLGPKPAEGPSDWLFRGRLGNPQPVYGGAFDVPYFAPLKRYGACPNNPHWFGFQKSVVTLAAKCGYDGVFIDNCVSGGDYCKHCWARFDEFLRRTPQTLLEDRFGVADRKALRAWTDVPAKLHSRFRLEMLRDYVVTLRDHARTVSPSFFLFANNPSLTHCFLLGEGCELIMWENAFPSGCLIEGEPPQRETLGIEVVVAPLEEAPATHRLSFRHPELFVELAVEIHLPTRCTVDQPLPVSVEVQTVGNSNRDDDAVEDVALVFKKQGDTDEHRVALGPSGRIGGVVPDVVHKPPVELQGAWTPKAAGTYGVRLEYRYTDVPHLDVTNRKLVRDRIQLGGCVYQNHIGEFSLAACGKARIIPHGRGTHPELAFAECAAFGHQASASVAEQWAVVRYQRFFRAHADLFTNAQPFGQVALLGAYWGGNPYHALRMVWPNVADHLSAQHVLFKSLLDATLTAEDLRGVRALVLIARDYEMGVEALKALQQFARRGSQIILQHSDTSINGVPATELLDAAIFPLWDWDDPPDVAPPISPSGGRQRGLRFAAYVDLGQRWIILHAVNYNVALVGANRGEVVPVEDVEVTLPLSGTRSPTSVTAIDPAGPSKGEPLRFAREPGLLTFTIPKLRVHKVVIVNLAAKHRRRSSMPSRSHGRRRPRRR